MIKRLDEIAQKEFDKKVRKAKRWNFVRTNVFGRSVDSPTRNNYTNNVCIMPYDESTQAVVKSPSISSWPRYNIGVFLYKRAGLVGHKYISNSRRVKQEKSKLELLHSKGCNVPESIYTTVDGVIVTKYLEGKSFDSLDGKGKIKALEKGTESLQQIHQYCPHGDPSAQNIVLVENDAFWLDPETAFDPTVPPIDLLAQDLILFIESAVKHTRVVQPTVEIVCESYDNPEVLERALLHNRIKNVVYRRIVHNIGYELAAQTKQAVDEQITKMLKRAWGDLNSRPTA